jgi:DNA polymerase family A
LLISWDTEHEPGDEYTKLKPLTCVSYACEDGTSGLLHARDPRAREFVATALSHHTSVGANIAHDMAEACLEWPELIPLVWRAYAEGRVRCLIMCEVLRSVAAGTRAEPAYKGGLEAMALRYGFGQLDKDPAIRMGYGPLRDVSLDLWNERQRKYAMDDALAGLHIARKQPLPVDWENASRADFCCTLMGAWGFRTHPGRVERLRTEYWGELQKRIEILTRGNVLRKLNKSKKLLTPDAYSMTELLAAQVLRANPGNKTGYSENTYVTLARMAATGATRMTKRKDGTDSDRLSCDAEACEYSGDPVLEALAEYSSFEKRIGDCDTLAQGELHCWFKPVMTNNQTSCSSPYNAQNPPTEGGERNCIVPRPGMCFIDADYNLFQLRTFAQVCLEIVQQSTMADILNDPKGPNLHTITAATILNIPWQQYDKKKDRAERGDKNAYDIAKRCNFGFGADMGYKRFYRTCSKQGIRPTEQEFWTYKNAWKRAYPEAPMYFAYIQSLGRGAQITELFTGRQRGGCSYTDAANGYFSALAASAAKAAWFQLARECYDPSQGSVLFGSRPVNFVHDQFIIETPDDAGAHDRAMRVKEIMETETRPFLPDVPATTDPCLADRWDKAAEAIFDSKGRLMVWSPVEDRKAA